MHPKSTTPWKCCSSPPNDGSISPILPCTLSERWTLCPLNPCPSSSLLMQLSLHLPLSTRRSCQSTDGSSETLCRTSNPRIPYIRFSLSKLSSKLSIFQGQEGDTCETRTNNAQTSTTEPNLMRWWVRLYRSKTTTWRFSGTSPSLMHHTQPCSCR